MNEGDLGKVGFGRGGEIGGGIDLGIGRGGGEGESIELNERGENRFLAFSAHKPNFSRQFSRMVVSSGRREGETQLMQN